MAVCRAVPGNGFRGNRAARKSGHKLLDARNGLTLACY
jgi:hypothetical protein